MDFWDLTKLLARRWMVAVPMLILSAGLTWMTFTHVKPDYVATAYVQLVPPVLGPSVPGQATPDQSNPWLGQGLQTIGNAANVTVLDKTFVEQLHAHGYSETFTSTMDQSTPLMTIEVVGSSKEQARQTADVIVKRYTDSVTNLQAVNGVRKELYISARRLDAGMNVEQSNSKVKRALVGIAGAGLLMTAAVTVGADAWLRRRRRRPPAAARPKPPPTPPTPNNRRPLPEMTVRLAHSTADRAGDDDAPTTVFPVHMPVATSDGNKGGLPGVTVQYQSADQAATASPDPGRQVLPIPTVESADTTIVLPLFLPRRNSSPGANGDTKPRS